MTGDLITDSYSGNTEFESTPFTGNLNAVPGLATSRWFIGGVGAFGVMARRCEISENLMLGHFAQVH